jgi:ketosteroid isomerase-like protein
VFKEYLERFASGDIDAAAELLSDDFTFEGPVLQASGKAEFLAGSAGLAPMVRGCEFLRQWADGEEVCSIYDFKIETPVGAGSISMAEWSVVRDGQLVSSRLVFDTAAMAALMPASE